MRKDSKYESRDEAAKGLWEKVDAEAARRKNVAYQEQILSLKEQAEQAKGQKCAATTVTGDKEAEDPILALTRELNKTEEDYNETEYALNDAEPDSDEHKRLQGQFNRQRNKIASLQAEIDTHKRKGRGDTLTQEGETQWEQEIREAEEVHRQEERERSPRNRKNKYQSL